MDHVRRRPAGFMSFIISRTACFCACGPTCSLCILPFSFLSGCCHLEEKYSIFTCCMLSSINSVILDSSDLSQCWISWSKYDSVLLPALCEERAGVVRLCWSRTHASFLIYHLWGSESHLYRHGF